MRRTNVILILLASVFLFYSCSQNDDDNPIANDGLSQIVLAWVEYDNDYWDEAADSIVSAPNVEVDGIVIANELPEFNFFKIGNRTFSTKPYFHYWYGYIYFENEDQPILNKLNPVTIEVSTSSGKVSGSLKLPDTIKVVNWNVGDTLQLGQTLEISWSGSNANFYDFSGEYEWRDEHGDWHYKNLDTLVSGNSITFDGSMFSHRGEINIWGINPINGPFPTVGAKPNMQGDGKGYMYYANDSKELYITIIVDKGLYKMNSTNTESGNYRQPLSRNIIEKVRQKLGLGVQKKY